MGSPLGPNGQQAKGAGRIDLGKAGSIACLEELEEAGKKKQMAEWSSDRYAARQACSPTLYTSQSPYYFPLILGPPDVAEGTPCMLVKDG